MLIAIELKWGLDDYERSKENQQTLNNDLRNNAMKDETSAPACKLSLPTSGACQAPTTLRLPAVQVPGAQDAPPTTPQIPQDLPEAVRAQVSNALTALKSNERRFDNYQRALDCLSQHGGPDAVRGIALIIEQILPIDNDPTKLSRNNALYAGCSAILNLLDQRTSERPCVTYEKLTQRDRKAALHFIRQMAWGEHGDTSLATAARSANFDAICRRHPWFGAGIETTLKVASFGSGDSFWSPGANWKPVKLLHFLMDLPYRFSPLRRTAQDSLQDNLQGRLTQTFSRMKSVKSSSEQNPR